MRHALIPHPETGCDAVTSLTVEVGRADPATLALRFVLMGDLERLAIPSAAPSVRTDGLWKHTCFEAFIGGPAGAYSEFNISPSTAWAAYAFDGYRQGMRALDIPAPEIAVGRVEGQLQVTIAVPLSLEGPRQLGLTAVIEDLTGRTSYWALNHPSARPDFHHPDGFVLRI